MIDVNGRCCGRKIIEYKQPPHLFCGRCCKSYHPLSKEQQANWAWKPDQHNPQIFRATYPDQEYAKPGQR